jgi:hypothetical protein
MPTLQQGSSEEVVERLQGVLTNGVGQWNTTPGSKLEARSWLTDDTLGWVDPAIPTLVVLASAWGETIGTPFRLVHDDAKVVERWLPEFEHMFFSNMPPGAGLVRLEVSGRRRLPHVRRRVDRVRRGRPGIDVLVAGPAPGPGPPGAGQGTTAPRVAPHKAKGANPKAREERKTARQFPAKSRDRAESLVSESA